MLIEKVIGNLKQEPDAFAILSLDEMSYIQCFRIEQGFVVEFQLGSLQEHYVFENYISSIQCIKLFCNYLKQVDSCQQQSRFKKLDRRTIWHKLGYIMGHYVGKFIKGLKDGKASANNK